MRPAQHAAAKHLSPNPHSLSSIASANGEGGGLLSSVWSGIKTIFSSLFCCFSYSEKVGALSSEQLTELRATFTTLLSEFKANKGKMSVENFKAWWKPEFEALDEAAQHLIMVEDMKGWAIGKLRDHESTVTPDMVTQHAESLCLDEGNRAKSLAFVRDLKVAVDKGTEFDPRDDKFVPRYFAEIIKHLNAQIEKQAAE